MSQRQVSRQQQSQQQVLAQKQTTVQRQRADELVNMHEPELLRPSPLEPDENQSPDDPTVLPEHEGRPWPEQLRFFSGRYHVLFVIEQTNDKTFVVRSLIEPASDQEMIEPGFQEVFDAYKALAQRVAEVWGELIEEYPELQQNSSEVEPELVARLLARLNAAVIDASQELGGAKLKPKNLGAEKYFHPACVLLPNGVPVSLSLLLGQKIGRKGKSGKEAPLHRVPDTITLLAISRVLQEEDPNELLPDKEIASKMRKKLQTLGYENMARLTNTDVDRFRARFKRKKGLKEIAETLLPNQRTRKEIYAQAGLVETQS